MNQTFSIIYKPSAQKELDRLPKHKYFAIKDIIENLRQNPYPSGYKKMNGKWDSCHRIRHGDYRIIYLINKSEIIIYILKIGNRKDIYR